MCVRACVCVCVCVSVCVYSGWGIWVTGIRQNKQVPCCVVVCAFTTPQRKPLCWQNSAQPPRHQYWGLATTGGHTLPQLALLAQSFPTWGNNTDTNSISTPGCVFPSIYDYRLHNIYKMKIWQMCPLQTQ